MTQSLTQSINQSLNQSINQSLNQPINPSITQSINQSVTQSINQSWIFEIINKNWHISDFMYFLCHFLVVFYFFFTFFFISMNFYFTVCRLIPWQIVHTDIATTETIAHGQVAVAPPKNDALTVGNSSSTSLVAVVLPSVFDIPPPVTAAAVVTTTTPTNPTVVTTSFPVPAMTDAVIVPFFEATHPAEHQETTAISEVDVSHVNDTFIGHVPIAFASGHGVSHVGTATTGKQYCPNNGCLILRLWLKHIIISTYRIKENTMLRRTLC